MVRRLIVAPHPDDEVMGCGGLMAKYPGTMVVTMSVVDPRRRSEQRAALAMLEAVLLDDLGFHDGSIGLPPHAPVARLDEVFRQHRPDEVYLPWPGTHQDHVATYEAGVRAARMSLDPDHWMPPSVLVYETPAYDVDLHAWPLRYSVFEALEEEHVMAKCVAMEAYESVGLKPHPGSPEHLSARAREIGIARGLEYAEQFAPVRVVRR